ncbi:hypothetical protein BD324DRAFT_611478 [Kockovaella imperatae]|uniref:VTT domain-containing protein n=1 Tax=Kockovaella imperatae TaxID=4999 RepID=A0A1Y1URK7_9TREE|nr:hypothetical protein BD324DRAFT_611478 [Kockovaella imperatae]ORX40599.1 hypothetical protein BD324DRAFT_611478 [Kockovaella imperatae]
MSEPFSSAPPSYTSSPRLAGYAQPSIPGHASPPRFRQRKSTTIVQISSSSSSGASSDDGSLADQSQDNGFAYTSSTSKPTSPAKTEASLPPTRSDTRQNLLTDTLMKHARHSSIDRRTSDDSSVAEEGEIASETTSLLGQADKAKWYRGPYAEATVKFTALFVVFTAFVAITFYLCLPRLEPEDRAILKIPHSFADLQALNAMFQKYKRGYPLRILTCGIVTYLFVQTFSLPGSMYIAIVFGAAYGIGQGLILACICESVGSVLCYLLSAVLAPPLLMLPFYRSRVAVFRAKLMGDATKGQTVSTMDIFAFLLVLRISPFPPHGITNLVCPHLGIGLGLFWLSCFIGIAPMSLIHVTIGSSLDSMTSAADFHILSVRNILGMIAVAVAILIPVGLKRIFKKDLGDMEETAEALEEAMIEGEAVADPLPEDAVTRRYQAVDSGVVLAGPSPGDPNLDTGVPAPKNKGKGRAVEIIPDIVEEDEDEEDSTMFKPRPTSAFTGLNDKKNAARFTNYGAVDRIPQVARHQPEGDRTWTLTR